MDYDPERCLLRLAPALGRTLTAGTAFEVISGRGGSAARRAPADGNGPGDGRCRRARMRLATTLGTNALLERRGVPDGAVHHARVRRPAAHRDAAAAASCSRSTCGEPAPLYDAVVEVAERLDADGTRAAARSTRQRSKRDARDLARSRRARRRGRPDARLPQPARTSRRCASVLLELGLRARLLLRRAGSADQAAAPRADRGRRRLPVARRRGPTSTRVRLGPARAASLLVMTSAGGLLDPEQLPAQGQPAQRPGRRRRRRARWPGGAPASTG